MCSEYKADARGCERCRALLFDYSAELTNEKQTQWIQEHMENCPSCAKEYEELCRMLAVMEHAPEPALPIGFQLRLHQKLVAAAEEKTQKSRKAWLTKLKHMGGWKVVSPALVCLVLVIGVFSSGLYDRWQNADSVLESGIPEATSPAASLAPDNRSEAATQAESETVSPAPAFAAPKATDPKTSVPERAKMPAAASKAPRTPADAGTAGMPAPSRQPSAAAASEQETAPGGGAKPTTAPQASTPMPAAIEDGVDALEDTAEASGARSSVHAETKETSGSVPESAPMLAGAYSDNAEPVQEASVTAEAGGGAGSAETSEYYVITPEMPPKFLDACGSTLGVPWRERAEALREDYVVLTLSETEWERFSLVIRAAGAETELWRQGTTGTDVTIILQGYED